VASNAIGLKDRLDGRFEIRVRGDRW
jgi:hypothetical protein